MVCSLASVAMVACAGPSWVTTRSTMPPLTLAEPDVVRFVAIGDVGKGNHEQRRLAAQVRKTCRALGCDMVLLLGDNLYPRGFESPDDPRAKQRILDPYAPTGAPLYLVLGNHDYAHGRNRERAGWQIAWANRTVGVSLPAHAWALDAGPMRLIGLDTAAAFQFGAGPQRDWLEGELANSTAPWTVVAGHHPLRSNGLHGNAGAYEGWSGMPWMSGAGLGRWLQTLCGQADLYLAGHDHSRQLLRHCGTDLVVSGAGSSTTPIVDRGNESRFASSSLGFAWFELRKDRGVVSFVDEDGRADGPFPLQGT